jgi:hypothetical protein
LGRKETNHMFTSIKTYSPAVIDTRFMLAVADVRPWGRDRLHADAGTDIITLARRSLR